MKILSVSNCPIETHHGSGYVISGYADGMRRRGHEITLLAPRDYEWLPRLRAGKRLRLFLGYNRAVRRALARERFDVVELWGGEAWWSMRRLAHRLRRPLLVARSNGLEPHFRAMLEQNGVEAHWRHGGLRQRVAGRLFDRWQDTESAFRCADLLTTVSEFDRRFARVREYQPDARMLTLENPLPDEWLGLGLPARRPCVLGYFGGWYPRKGADLLTAVLPCVLRDQPGWKLQLVGVGALRPDFLGTDLAGRVEVVPFEADKVKLRDRYLQTAVTLMASPYESYGLVAAEALACGCALVASPTGLAADLRPDREAIIVPGRTVADWIRAIEGLLRDDAQRSAIAAAGYARAQTLRWTDAVGRLEACYLRLLAERNFRAQPGPSS